MTNWLLAHMRQPGRRVFADFTQETWYDLLEELLSKDYFGCQDFVSSRMGYLQDQIMQHEHARGYLGDVSPSDSNDKADHIRTSHFEERAGLG